MSLIIIPTISCTVVMQTINKMLLRGALVISLSVVCAIFSPPRSEYEGHLIRPDVQTHWGAWGSIEWCGKGTFARGFNQLIQPSGGLFTDDTALNAIALACVWVYRSLQYNVFVPTNSEKREGACHRSHFPSRLSHLKDCHQYRIYYLCFFECIHIIFWTSIPSAMKCNCVDLNTFERGKRFQIRKRNFDL